MYSVPLRRALVTGSDLPFPEGVAAAEVLKVGAGVGGAEENRRGLVAIVISSLGRSAGYFILAKTRLVARGGGAQLSRRRRRDRRFGQPVDGADRRRPPGRHGGRDRDDRRPDDRPRLAAAMANRPAPACRRARDVDADRQHDRVPQQVRFIGAGTIGVAAIWTLLKIIGPIMKGLKGAIAANRARRPGRARACR